MSVQEITQRFGKLQITKPAPLNKRQKKQVKSLISKGKELNAYKVTGSAVVFAATWTAVDLSAMPQGDGDSQRVGDDIRMKKLLLRFRVTHNSTNGGGALRIVVVQWRPNTLNDTFDSSKIFQTDDDVDSFPLWDNRHAYKILYDKSVATPNQVDNLKTILINKTLVGRKLGNKKISFNDGATTGSNKIHLLFIASNATNPDTLDYEARSIYTD